MKKASELVPQTMASIKRRAELRATIVQKLLNIVRTSELEDYPKVKLAKSDEFEDVKDGILEDLKALLTKPSQTESGN